MRGQCIDSAGFGLLCPLANLTKFDAAVTEARRLAAEFNASSKLYQVKVRVLRGRIANTDQEAMQAIGGEINELLDTISSGLARNDVKATRDAADRAKALSKMLQPGVAERVEQAIEAARKTATEVAKAQREKITPVEAIEFTSAAVAVKAINVAKIELDLSDDELNDDGQIELPPKAAAPAYELDLGD